MADGSVAGFREHEHTADWELEAWGPDLAALLEQAARGMYTLMGTVLQSAPRVTREQKFQKAEPEVLLVKFLQELLYLSEMEGLGFDQYELSCGEAGLNAVLTGAPQASCEKEIKAVTYHNLQILQTARGLSVVIVFDV